MALQLWAIKFSLPPHILNYPFSPICILHHRNPGIIMPWISVDKVRSSSNVLCRKWIFYSTKISLSVKKSPYISTNQIAAFSSKTNHFFAKVMKTMKAIAAIAAVFRKTGFLSRVSKKPWEKWLHFWTNSFTCIFISYLTHFLLHKRGPQFVQKWSQGCLRASYYILFYLYYLN